MEVGERRSLASHYTLTTEQQTRNKTWQFPSAVTMSTTMTKMMSMGSFIYRSSLPLVFVKLVLHVIEMS